MRAMVLCAGLGTRLGRLTADVPKPLLELHGVPILEYILGQLAVHGFREVLINLHFKAEAIRERFGSGARFGLRLDYSYEPELLGTAGAVKRAEAFFEGEPFLVHYGDILTDQDLSLLARHHLEEPALVTLLVHRRLSSNSVVRVEEGGVVSGFWERPLERPDVPEPARWVFSGICMCSPELLCEIPQERPSDFPRDVFPRLVSRQALHAVPLSGYRCAIDSPERLEEARTAVADGRFKKGWRDASLSIV